MYAIYAYTYIMVAKPMELQKICKLVCIGITDARSTSPTAAFQHALESLSLYLRPLVQAKRLKLKVWLMVDNCSKKFIRGFQRESIG